MPTGLKPSPNPQPKNKQEGTIEIVAAGPKREAGSEVPKTRRDTNSIDYGDTTTTRYTSNGPSVKPGSTTNRAERVKNDILKARMAK